MDIGITAGHIMIMDLTVFGSVKDTIGVGFITDLFIDLGAGAGVVIGEEVLELMHTIALELKAATLTTITET